MNSQYPDGVSPIRIGSPAGSLREEIPEGPMLSRPSGLFYEIEALVNSIRKMERSTGDAHARLRQAESLYLQERAKAEDFAQRLRTIDAEHSARTKALSEQIRALESERDKLLTQYRQLTAAFKKSRLDGEETKRLAADAQSRLASQEREWERKLKESEARFARVDSQREQLEQRGTQLKHELENWRERANTQVRRVQEAERVAAQASHERSTARAEADRLRGIAQNLERDLGRYQHAWRELAERESQQRRSLAEVRHYHERLQAMKNEIEQWKLHTASLQKQGASVARELEMLRKEQSENVLKADRQRTELEKEILRLKGESHRALSDAAAERATAARLQAQLLEQKDQARSDALRLQAELERLRETYPMRDLIAFKDAQSRRSETPMPRLPEARPERPRATPVPPPFPGYPSAAAASSARPLARPPVVEPIAMEVLDALPDEAASNPGATASPSSSRIPTRPPGFASSPRRDC